MFVAETEQRISQICALLANNVSPEWHSADGEEYTVDPHNDENLYGGGQWWIIAENAIWHVAYYDMDVDIPPPDNRLSCGAIALKYQKVEALETALRERAFIKMKHDNYYLFLYRNRQTSRH